MMMETYLVVPLNIGGIVCDGIGDTEVNQLNEAPGRYQDVPGLDITMCDRLSRVV